LHIIHGWCSLIHKRCLWCHKIIWLKDLNSTTEPIQQTFMPPWITGTKILIQFLLHLNLKLHLVACRIQDLIGHIKVQKDQTQLITNNITSIVLLQTLMDGTPILILKNWHHNQIKNIWKIKSGRRIFQLGQIQLIINNTTLAAQLQICKLTQGITFLL
jgi:hypothetical protein